MAPQTPSPGRTPTPTYHPGRTPTPTQYSTAPIAATAGVGPGVDLGILLDASSIIVFCIDLTGHITAWGAGAQELTGVAADKAVGELFAETFVSEVHEKQAVAEAISQAQKGMMSEVASCSVMQTVDESETFSTLPGPFIRQVRFSFMPRRASALSVVSIMVVGQDCTELHEAKACIDKWVHPQHSSSELHISTDAQGRITEWSSGVQSLTGVSPQEALGRSFVGCFLAPEARDEFFIAEAEARSNPYTTLASLNAIASDFRCILKGAAGMPYEARLSVTASRDTYGNITSMHYSGSGRTGLKSENETSMDTKALLDACPSPAFMIDNQGKVYEWNSEAAETFGISSDEAIGCTFLGEIATPETTLREAVCNALASVCEGGAKTQVRVATMRGKPRWLTIHAAPRRPGLPSGAMCTACEEATSTASEATVEGGAGLALAAARHANSELAHFITMAPTPIFSLDANGLVLEWSIAMVTDLCFSREEVIGKAFIDVVIEESRQAVWDALVEIIIGGPDRNVEVPLVARPGQLHSPVLQLFVICRRGVDGAPCGLICIGQDVSPITAVRSEVSQLAAEKNALSSLMGELGVLACSLDAKGVVIESCGAVTLSKGEHILDQMEDSCKVEVATVLTKVLQGRASDAPFSLFVPDSNGQKQKFSVRIAEHKGVNKDVALVLIGQEVPEVSITQVPIESEHEKILRLVDAATFTIDLSGEISDWPSSVEQRLGIASKDAMGKPVAELLGLFEAGPAISHAIILARRGLEAINVDTTLIINGKVSTALLSSCPHNVGSNMMGVQFIVKITGFTGSSPRRLSTVENLPHLLPELLARVEPEPKVSVEPQPLIEQIETIVESLATSGCSDHGVTLPLLPTIVKAGWAASENLTVITKALELVVKLGTVSAEGRRGIMTAGGHVLAAHVLQNSQNSLFLQVTACKVLAILFSGVSVMLRSAAATAAPIEAVVAACEAHVKFGKREYLTPALEILLGLCRYSAAKRQHVYEAGGANVTMQAMTLHISVPAVQEFGCEILFALLGGLGAGGSDRNSVGPGLVSSEVSLLNNHESTEVARCMRNAMEYDLGNETMQFFALKSCSVLARTFLLAEVRLPVIAGLRNYPDSVRVQTEACNTLLALSETKNGHGLTIASSPVAHCELILQAMLKHSQDLDLQVAATRALVALNSIWSVTEAYTTMIQEEEVGKWVLKAGAMDAIAAALQLVTPRESSPLHLAVCDAFQSFIGRVPNTDGVGNKASWVRVTVASMWARISNPEICEMTCSGLVKLIYLQPQEQSVAVEEGAAAALELMMKMHNAITVHIQAFTVIVHLAYGCAESQQMLRLSGCIERIQASMQQFANDRRHNELVALGRWALHNMAHAEAT